MQYLSGLNAGVAGSEINLGFELGDFTSGADNSWGNTGDSWGNTDSSWGNNDDDWGSSNSAWGGGWDFFGRKRRSTPGNMERGELLSEAIESLIFPQVKDMLPLNSRNRRFVMDWMAGQQPADHDEAERIKGEMADLRCFKSMFNDDSQLEAEGEEEEEEEVSEEEFEDPYVRVRQQRKETDHDGIRNWVADKYVFTLSFRSESNLYLLALRKGQRSLAIVAILLYLSKKHIPKWNWHISAKFR